MSKHPTVYLIYLENNDGFTTVAATYDMYVAIADQQHRSKDGETYIIKEMTQDQLTSGEVQLLNMYA